MRVFLYAVPLVYLLYSWIIVFFIKSHTYEDLLRFYRKRWPTGFDVEWISACCYTREWDAGVREHAVLWMIGIAVIMALYLGFIRRILLFIDGLLRDIRIGWSFLRRSFFILRPVQKMGLGVVFGGLLLYWGYLFMHYPLYPDETVSYVFFARRGFFFTVMNYPVPNNHLFLNVCAGVLNELPFLTPRLVMRLPSMTAAFFLYYLIFCLFFRWGSYQRALVSVIGVAFVHLLSFYAVQGRGYQLQTLFAVVGGLAAWAYWLSSRWAGRPGYALFVVTSILGCYCNPQFLYPFLTLILLLGYQLLRDRRYPQLLVLGGALGIVTAVVMILYLPVILCNSWNGLTNNMYLRKQSWSFLLHQGSADFYYIFKYIFFYGYMAVWVVGGAVVLSVYLYWRRVIGGEFYRYAFGYFVAAMLAFVILTIDQRQYPLDRGLCYWVLALNLLFVNVLYDAVRHYFRRPGVAMTLLGLFLFVKTTWSLRPLYAEQYRWYNDGQVKLYADMQRDFPRLAALHPGSWQVMQSDSYYSMYLRLYLGSHRLPEEVVVDARRAKGDVLFVPDDRIDSLALGGYVLWADKRLKPLDSLKISIFVRPELLRRP